MSTPNGFSVPKFSSFKPKVANPVPNEKENEAKEKGGRPYEPRNLGTGQKHRSRSRSQERRLRHEDKDRKTSSRHDSRRNSHRDRDERRSERHEARHHHTRHRSRSRSPGKVLVRRHRSPSEEPRRTPPAPPVAEPASTAFIIDRKGDPQNLVYGRIHRYDVPRFRRMGNGCVMGLPRRFRMERGVAEEAERIVLVDQRQIGVGKREKYAFARNEKRGARLLRIKLLDEDDSVDPLAGNRDFVPLSRPKKRKRSDSDSSVDGNFEKKHFQLIELPPGPEVKPDNEGLEYATESDSDEEGRTIRVDEATRLRHVELSREVDKDPTSIEAWLALIDHQDSMLGLGEHAHRKITTAEIQSTAEIKLSMYEKALKAAGSTLQHRERLLLGMMKEGSKVWSQDEQSKRWEKIASQEVASSKLWKKYIDFRMSDFQGYVYQDTKDLFQDRLHLLAEAKQRIAEKQGADPEKLDSIHRQMIYVLLRATLFMREAGYTEWSVAIWQGVLEFNLSCRRDSGGARENKFDEFWDSDVPRIGEKGAKGWKDFSDSEMEPEVRIDKEIPSSSEQYPDAFDGWAKAERFRAAEARWPAKTCDETVEDDPYRVILWSDIQEFVIDLGFTRLGGWEISPSTHRMLVDAFLIFCRMPPLIRAGWSNDQFASDSIIEACTAHIQKEYLDTKADAEEALDPLGATRKDASRNQTHNNIFAAPAQNAVLTTDFLFPSPQWATIIPKWSDIYGSDTSAGPLDFHFVQRTLDTLSRSYPSDELGEYYLAFMSINQPAGIKNLASSLISACPQSRRLYNAYALILWNSGKKEKAIGVWSQVLGVPSTDNREQEGRNILLWRSRVWCHLEDGDVNMAIRCLLSIPSNATDMEDIDTTSPVLRLRAKQHLASTRDFLLGSTHPALSALHAECLALLYYLLPSDTSNGRDIEGALGVIDHFTDALKSYNHSLSPHHEAILQFSTRLLWTHIRTGPFRPALIRQRMTSALTLFPQNTIFLALYTWNEARARIDDRVRAMLRDRVLLAENDCVTSRVFAIRYEIQRGNMHTVRAAFEHAVASEGCQGNAGLWRLYVLWCAQSTDEKVKAQAKEVLYRGMRACPGVKPLMMDAFEALKPLMTREDIKSVYKVMEEKEVRIHVNLEDWMDEHSQRQ